MQNAERQENAEEPAESEISLAGQQLHVSLSRKNQGADWGPKTVVLTPGVAAKAC